MGSSTKIEYGTKEQGQVNPEPEAKKLTFQNANEIKNVVNANANLLEFASLQTGILTGGEVTINGGDNTKFDVAEGTGIVIDWTDPSNPVRTEVSWDEFLAQSIPNLATGLFTTVQIGASGNMIILSGVIGTSLARRENIQLQTLVHDTGVQIDAVSRSSKPAYDVTEALLDYVIKLGPINSGNDYTANGANLQIDRASGDSTLPFINRANDTQSPTTLITAQESIVTFNTIYRDGVGDFVIIPSVTDIDPDLWDDGSGTLAAVSNNRWTVQRIFFFGQSLDSGVSFGQATYSTLEAAEASIPTESPLIAPIFQLGVFVTALIVKKGATDLSDIAVAKFVDIT